VVVVVEAPNNRAPAFPSTSKVIVPTRFEPLKKSAEIRETTLVFGWVSRPKMVKGLTDVKDSEVRPLVQRIRGVELSVLPVAPSLKTTTKFVATNERQNDAVHLTLMFLLRATPVCLTFIDGL
jgi:hypothetical protein